ncbi:MAG TPA: hypothetical protein VFN72_11150 [Solirubrobacterales bacterium]|nr:hypothetical protein [Solirubrobacterales bacterium]
MRELGLHPRAGEQGPPVPRELGIRRLLAAGISRLRWRALDRALVRGADPSSSATLEARARRLTSPAARARLASSVREVIMAASRPPTLASSRIPPSRPEAPAARLTLAAIELLLKSDSPVYAQGMARLELLLTDGGGPLYSPDYPAALSVELDRIMDALGAREENWLDGRAHTG